MSFAQNLEYLLKANNMSRYRFSKLTGYSQTTLANWIGAKTTPYSKDREAVAQVFNITVEELMGDDLPPIRKQKKSPPLSFRSEEVDFNVESIVNQIDGGLSEKDMRLLAWFRSLPVEKQKAILTAQDAPTGLV